MTKRLSLSLILLSLFLSCSYLTESKPILKQSEIERMIAGRIDAEYVGTDNCLKNCHEKGNEHKKLADYFKKSVHAEQIDKETHLPLVNCETCHGPGSLAIDNIKEVNGKKQCDFESLINLKKLPAEAKNLICLKCHTKASTPNLAMWRGSAHDLAGVACSDCHRLHTSPLQKVEHAQQINLCLSCHKKIKVEISNLSKHPLNERKIVCTDCHNPHGSMTSNLLKRESVRETCAYCHTEKGGPYTFEHADLMEDCSNCHVPHGSINDNLLKVREPILCLRCHEGHHSFRSEALTPKNKLKFYNRCTDCHLSIHGTDTPSGSTTTLPKNQGRMLR